MIADESMHAVVIQEMSWQVCAYVGLLSLLEMTTTLYLPLHPIPLAPRPSFCHSRPLPTYKTIHKLTPPSGTCDVTQIHYNEGADLYTYLVPVRRTSPHTHLN